MGKKKIAVVFGGCSSEHEISCISAASVIDNLPKDKYEPICLGITKKGRWYLFSGPTEEIADGRWERNALNVPAFLSPDRNTGGIVVDGKMGFDVIKV
ncbi:MAG: D-alanine--D-alanine ligase, partial [Clostridiales bacterium]|nr:D-alanine--D-alanine ligase [Clostridiales bacterium]